MMRVLQSIPSGMSNIINHNSDDITKPASDISPIKSQDSINSDDLLAIVEKYFILSDSDQRQAYAAGKSDIIRDEFDIHHFINSIHSILQTHCKDQAKDKHVSISITKIFKGFENLNDILGSLNSTHSADHLVVLRLLSYCLYSYFKYNQSYDRHKQIQAQVNRN